MSSWLNQAYAREWFVTPRVSSQLIFDTNYRLRSNRDIEDKLDTIRNEARTIKPKDTIGGRLSAGAIVGSETENSDIHIRGNVDFNRFTIDNFNSTNVFLYPEAWFTVSPRDKLGISGKLFLDTTLAQENLSAAQVADDTGNSPDRTADLFGIPKRRFMKSIKPEWNHSLTEKTSLNLSYEFTDVTYEDALKRRRLQDSDLQDPQDSGRTDYSMHTGQLHLSHQLFHNTLVFSNASVTYFSTPETRSSTTYYSLQAGIQHKFSERWEAEIVAGGRYSVSDSTTERQDVVRDTNNIPILDASGKPILRRFDVKDNSSGLGSLANASITHHYETGSLTASIAQDIRPTGNGDLQTSNEVEFIWDYKLSEHLNFNLPISALRASAINSESNRLDRTYYQAAPALSWMLTPEFSLTLSYRYRYQKYDDIENSADSHNAMLSASYQWQRQSISR
ncbi:MAG: hypothetical protein V3V18_03460 [Methylococcales bacterium]